MRNTYCVLNSRSVIASRAATKQSPRYDGNRLPEARVTHVPRSTHHALWLAIVLLALSACAAPAPAQLSLTPTISPSPVPAVSPSLTPSSAPTLIPDQPIPEPALLPALETTLDLGTRGMTDDWQLQHAIALDEKNQRLYVSTSISKTVVLDAETLTPIGEIEVGGSVAVLPERDKLYIGVAGAIYYDGTTPNVPAELRVYDASTLAFRRSALFSDTSSSPPLAVPISKLPSQNRTTSRPPRRWAAPQSTSGALSPDGGPLSSMGSSPLHAQRKSPRITGPPARAGGGR